MVIFWSLASLKFCHHGGNKKGSDERRNPYLNALSHTAYPKRTKALTHAPKTRSGPAIQIRPEFTHHSKQSSQKDTMGILFSFLFLSQETLKTGKVLEVHAVVYQRNSLSAVHQDVSAFICWISTSHVGEKKCRIICK